MITIVTGSPGSGKSYYMVSTLVKRYFDYDSKFDKYTIKQLNGKPYTIITNIENLQLPHISLDHVLMETGLQANQFFTVDYQKKVMLKYDNVVYIVDECQRYFDDSINKITDCKYFFEYHRHLGMDIFLMAQSYHRINKAIQGLEEFHIHAAKRMISVFGEFRYNVMSGYEIVDTQIIKKSKRIFNLYQSRLRNEQTKNRNPLIKYLIAVVILLVFCGWAFKKTFFDHQKEKGKILINQTTGVIKNTEQQINAKTEESFIQPEYKNVRLSVIVVTSGKTQKVLYVDYSDNSYYPIEMIDLPIIKITNNGKTDYYVRTFKNDNRFNPTKEKEIEKKKESSTGSLVGV